MEFDPSLPYGLHRQVALRPEPFGALAYHYGNRRLTFLKSPGLVDLVRQLEGYPSAAEALDALVEPSSRRQYEQALASLEASEVIRCTVRSQRSPTG